MSILLAGAAMNAAAYILTRWWVFGMVSACCAVTAAVGAAGNLMLARLPSGLECCPHDEDDTPTEPIPVITQAPCRGCRQQTCLDCFPQWEVIKW
jgi:hypothetical protein